jgi:FlaA1/EpsC-like NDP-sugar epimerase
MMAPAFNRRIATVAVHDLFMAALSFELAVKVRYWFTGAPAEWGFLWHGTVLFTLLCAGIFWRFGLYRGIWYYASLRDLSAIVRAVTAAVLLLVPVLFVFTRLEDYPRSALPLLWAFLIVMLTAPRFAYRAYKDGNLRAAFGQSDTARVPVLLVGAADAADAFIREMTRSRAAPYEVVGIVDDRPGRIGRDIRGVRVMGSIDDIPLVLEQLARKNRTPHRLVLAGDFEGALVRKLVDVAEKAGLSVGRIPRLADLREGKVDVRTVDVEDLLGRAQKVLDRDAMRRLIAGRRVLVTGAGGTIGSELVRQAAEFGPAHIALVENSEFNLYVIDRDLSERWPAVPRTAILADVRDPKRLAGVFTRERPEIVFHAAAFKHVPLSEQNPEEAILTNTIGTRNVAEACRAAGTSAMVVISTDKAVNASSVMGASKRAAELACQALARGDGPTRFVTVRFGNVLGSTGSVIPLFEHQLAAGLPLTVTHPDVTRYFMTVKEAVELVLLATAIPVEEAGRDAIFILDMGEPVRIQDLARQMVRLSGKKPGREADIVFTGLRPGEKLAEELAHAAEDLRASRYEGIRIGLGRAMDYELLKPRLERLERAARERRTNETLGVLAELVPEYRAATPTSATAG